MIEGDWVMSCAIETAMERRVYVVQTAIKYKTLFCSPAALKPILSPRRRFLEESIGRQSQKINQNNGSFSSHIFHGTKNSLSFVTINTDQINRYIADSTKPKRITYTDF